jgi:hypothetical protein
VKCDRDKPGILLRTVCVVITAVLMLACVDPKRTAREELSQLNIPYNTANFFSAIQNGDVIAVELFLVAGIDPNSVTTDSLWGLGSDGTNSLSALGFAKFLTCANPSNSGYRQIEIAIGKHGARKDDAEQGLANLIGKLDERLAQVDGKDSVHRTQLLEKLDERCLKLPLVATKLADNDRRLSAAEEERRKAQLKEEQRAEAIAALENKVGDLSTDAVLELARGADEDLLEIVIKESARRDDVRLKKFVLKNCKRNDWEPVQYVVASSYWSPRAWIPETRDEAMRAMHWLMLSRSADVRRAASVALSISGSKQAISILEGALASESDPSTLDAYRLAIKELRTSH